MLKTTEGEMRDLVRGEAVSPHDDFGARCANCNVECDLILDDFITGDSE